MKNSRYQTYASRIEDQIKFIRELQYKLSVEKDPEKAKQIRNKINALQDELW